MKFLLVGGDSNLGKALGASLISIGHTVLPTTRRPNGDGIFFDLESSPDNWPTWPADIDAAFIASAMTKQEDCAKYPDKARFINIEQTGRLIDQLTDRGIHVVYPSTNIVLACDRPHQPVNSPLSPQGIYAETKAEIEKKLSAQKLASIARLPKILDGNQGILHAWKQKMDLGDNIEAFDDLMISPVSLSHAVAFLTALLEQRPQGIWQLSGAQEISYYDLAILIATEKGTDPANIVRLNMPASLAAASPRHPGMDMSQTTEKLGISSQNPVEMLRDCFRAL